MAKHRKNHNFQMGRVIAASSLINNLTNVPIKLKGNERETMSVKEWKVSQWKKRIDPIH